MSAEYSIRDIAKLAGVSIGTVSRVLNHAGNVDEEIRRRTMAVVEHLRYQPGKRGRRPHTAPTRAPGEPSPRIRNIALISPGMGRVWQNNELWVSYLSGIERALQKRRCRLTLFMADDAAETVREVSCHADGLLVKLQNPLPGYVRELLPLIPAVGFGIEQVPDALPQVVADNTAAGLDATTRLLELGHRRIAFINHMARNTPFVARSNGYLEAMKSRGLFRREYFIELDTAMTTGLAVPETKPPDFRSTIETLLALSEPPSAVICANDWGAYGVLLACQACGVTVPGQLSLVGIDSTGTLCEMLRPTLSSVAMPLDRVAGFAAELLTDLLDGVGTYRRGVSSVVRLPGDVMLRDSVRAISEA